MSESNVMDYLAYGYQTTGGYACSSCGTWVQHGMSHACYQPSTYVFTPITLTTIDSARLAELMKAERKLKEIKRILEAS